MSSKKVRAAAAALFKTLRKIGKEHEEITDTDVREAVHMFLNLHFVWGEPVKKFPRTFEMFSAEGDKLVGEALKQFLAAVDASGEASGLERGAARLAILHNPAFDYDEFMGHVDRPLEKAPLPKWMYEPGDYDEEDED